MATTSSSSSTSSSSTSSQPASSTPQGPEPVPTTALTIAPPVCNDESDFPGHADINPDSVTNGVSEFCNANKDITMTPNSAEIRTNYQSVYDVNYLFMVEWTGGIGDRCSTSTNSQSVKSPIGDSGSSCEDMMQDTFSQCNNGGVGGFIQAGCLKYSFTGGLGDSESS